MRLVEQHVIKREDPRYKRIDAAAFASKNLWNLANYYVRQSFIFEHSYLDNFAVYHLVKSSEAYLALPAKVSNQVLIQLHTAWLAFFEAMEKWREPPEQFTGRPNIPGYQPKATGRNLLVYEMGAIWKRELDQGVIALSGLGALVQTAQSRQTVDQVRLVPKADHYVVEVVYQCQATSAVVDPDLFVAVDLGVNVLAALISNKAELVGIRVLLTVYDLARSEAQRFSGRRDGRWYYASGKRIIHADVNGSYNIGRKVVPTAFDGLGIAAPAVRRHLASRLNRACDTSCHEFLILFDSS